MDTDTTEDTDRHTEPDATVTPLLAKAFDTDEGEPGFISEARPIEVEEGMEIDTDFIAAGEEVVRSTYETILASLEALRAEKAAIQDRINELVEAEKLWAPMHRRVNEGIQHRDRVESDADQGGLPLD